MTKKEQNLNDSAIECIKNIANPLDYFYSKMAKDGLIINGQLAVCLCSDPGYLKNIAKNWLIKNQ